MKRELTAQLLHWKERVGRKPLILKGARQTGKTWLLKAFGKENFRRTHYVNFETDTRFKTLFSAGLRPNRILSQLALVLDEPIDTAHDLVVFDEIQLAPEALTALKYFREEQPDLAVASAGSHIGLTVSGSAFPVGQVEYLTLYPLSFSEFLDAVRPALADFLRNRPVREPVSDALHDALMRELRAYTAVGGMPEAVSAWRAAPQDETDPLVALRRVREIQAALAQSYASDFAKHAGKVNATDLARLFDNIPAQLARTVDSSLSRFRFKDALPGKTRFSAIAGPLDWLVRTGLALKVSQVERPDTPLNAYAAENLFKLYLLDVGLLGAMAGLAPRDLLLGDFGTYKGWVAENFVAQELTAAGYDPLYFWKGKTSEVDFLIATEAGVVPVEVKSGTVTRSKSLSVYRERFRPVASFRLSGRNSAYALDAVTDLPLYLAGRLGSYPKGC